MTYQKKGDLKNYFLASCGADKDGNIEKKYQVIYADPPWRYDFSPSKNRDIENHYPTMELEDIKNLQVPADNNCVLYLWATAPKLEEAIEVMTAWGFKYRTCLSWDKTVIGMGRWFRNQHELLLVGLKGQISTPSPEQRISSVYIEKRTSHSAKPTYFRDKISEWYPELSKIELFARPNPQLNFDGKTTFHNWDTWGNEIENEN